MKFNRCGYSGLKLAAVSLGLWHNFGGVDALENIRALCRTAFDLGVTQFDLTSNYGPPPGSYWPVGLTSGVYCSHAVALANLVDFKLSSLGVVSSQPFQVIS